MKFAILILFNLAFSPGAQCSDLGRAYADGKLKTDPFHESFRPSREEDVLKLELLSKADRLKAIQIACASIVRGEGIQSVMIAGAATRMNPSLAPKEVRELVGGRNIQSKAAIPLGSKGGKVYTFLGALMTNLQRLQQQIKEAIFRPVKLNLLIMTNREYAEEYEQEMREHDHYGFKEDQLFVFNQELGDQYIANPSDVNRWYEKEKRKLGENCDANRSALEYRYLKALKISENAHQKYLETGSEEEILLKGERAPLGHGEFFHQLISSGMFLKLIDRGIQWMSLRNIDNSAALFDENWLVILGLFLKEQLDFQIEVSPRLPGQKGGSLVISESGRLLLPEDSQFETSAQRRWDQDLEVPSFWMNDAVVILSLRYIMDIYKQKNQTDEEFIQEMRGATPEQRLAIADRGRSKYPKLLDPKPAKSSDAIALKVETSLWISTALVDSSKKVKAIGVSGIQEISEDFKLAKTAAEKAEIIENRAMRFLSTKQWLGKVESYEENKPYIDAVLHIVTEGNYLIGNI